MSTKIHNKTILTLFKREQIFRVLHVGVTSSSMNGSTSNRRGSSTSMLFKNFNRLSPLFCRPAVTNMIFIVHFHRRLAKPEGRF